MTTPTNPTMSPGYSSNSPPEQTTYRLNKNDVPTLADGTEHPSE